MKTWLVLWFLFLAICTHAQMEAGDFVAYGPETKYLASLNASVYQSQTGYLWINTMNGLVRFDGKRYTPFFSDFTNPNTVSSNRLSNVTEDKNGNLWIAGFDYGVTRYNQRTGRFRKFMRLSNDNTPLYGTNRIVNDYNGNLWVGTAGRGLAKYNFEKDTFDFFYPEPDFPKDGSNRNYNNVTDIVPDEENKEFLWIGSFHDLFLFDQSTNRFTYFPYDSSNKKTTLVVTDMEPAPDGKIWITTWGNGLQCFDTRRRKFLPIVFPKELNVIFDCKLVADSLLYIAALSKGLYKYNIHTGNLTDITPVTGGNRRNSDIQRVSVTRDAGIFIGGNFYIFQQHPFYKRMANNVIAGNKYEPITTLNGAIYDPTRNIYWLGREDRLYQVTSDLKIKQEIKSIFPGNAISKICLSQHGQLWLTNHQNGLFEWDEESNKIIRARLNLNDTIISSISDIAIDRTGNLWLYGKQKLHYYSKTGQTINYEIKYDKGYSGNRKVTGAQLKISPVGDAWLLSRQGIFIYNKHGFVKQLYETGANAKNMAITVVRDGSFREKYHDFWFSSGDGVQVMDYTNYSITANYNVANGLPAMLITGIVADDSSRVWVATTAGIGMYNSATNSWQTYNRLDGLYYDFLDRGFFLTENQRLVVANQGGISMHSVNEILLQHQPLHLRITNILVNSKPANDTLLPEFISSLRLPYNQNNIVIEFAAMDWLFPAKTVYQHKIEGLPGGDEWKINADAKLNLTALKAGEYTVHLRAINSSGIWSNEVVLPIIIRPVFWQTLWFLLLATASIIAISFLVFRYRLLQVRKLQRMRNQISKDLHDDIGASLSNIAILNELARRNMNKDVSKSSEYLNRSSDDIQYISENLSDIVWNINPAFDSSESLLVRMKRYAADMMEGKDIFCTFEFPEHLAHSLPMDKRRNFYLIFKEAVNNLVKYSHAKNAYLKVEPVSDNLKLTVKDDGIGFNVEKTKTGNGLQNMHYRAALSGATLAITSAPGAGTEVVLSMPL